MLMLTEPSSTRHKQAQAASSYHMYRRHVPSIVLITGLMTVRAAAGAAAAFA